MKAPAPAAQKPPENALAVRNGLTFTQLFPSSSLGDAFQGDLHERRIFHRFQFCTIPAFAGCADFDFWNNLVLRVGRQESIVRNAIVALGTLHEEYQLRGGRYNMMVKQQPSYQYALQLYSKAMTELNARLAKGDQEDTRYALISCILFVCFEILQRNSMAGLTHFESGIRVLLGIINQQRAASQSPATSQSPAPLAESEVETLLRIFARYDVQATSFTKPRVHNIYLPLARVPCTFQSLSECKIHLDNLLISMYQFLKSHKNIWRYWRGSDVPLEVLARKEDSLVAFTAWLDALDRFLGQSNATQLTPRETRDLVGLRLQAKVAIVQISTSIDSAPETSFDRFEPIFLEIVTLAEDAALSPSILSETSLSSYNSGNTIHFTMELGIIQPLYFTATKCRTGDLRRRAVAALRTSGREGVWDGPAMALLVERIMAIEEHGLQEGQFVPETNRLHDVIKDVDYEMGMIRYQSMKAMDNSFMSWETVRGMVPLDGSVGAS